MYKMQTLCSVKYICISISYTLMATLTEARQSLRSLDFTLVVSLSPPGGLLFYRAIGSFRMKVCKVKVYLL